MKTLRIVLLALLAALLLSAPAWADEEDADKRFHDAYVQEVIDGNVADAARVYLALMEDEDVAARLRAEARFRFAICAVLLGRADEGRTHLAALLADPATPKALRARAEEYRRTVAGIGVGTELDKKLQELVFDLGRANPATAAKEVYRDFEIIGRAAAPFLKKLLGHTDEKLRRHAFRLLCRLDEPGMATVWTPEIHDYDQHFVGDFVRFLERHPTERAAFEKRLLAFGEPALKPARYLSPWPAFSLDFIKAFAKTGFAPGTAVGWLGKLDDERFDLLVSWMEGEDEALANASLGWLLREGTQHEKADRQFHARTFAYLLEHLVDEEGWLGSQTLDAFSRYTRQQAPAVILDTLEGIVRDVEEHGGVIQERPSAWRLFSPVAGAFDKRKERPGPAEHARYGGLLMRWLALGPSSNERWVAAKENPDYRPFQPAAWVPHMAVALAGMEESTAMAHIRGIFAVPGRAGHAHWRSLLAKAHDGRSVRALAAAAAAAPRGERTNLLGRLAHDGPKQPSKDHLDALDEVRLDLMEKLTENELAHLFSGYYVHGNRLAPAKAEAELARILLAARDLPAAERRAVRQLVLQADPAYFENVLAPLAEHRWAWLDKEERRLLLKAAFKKISMYSRDGPTSGDAQAAALATIRPHVAEVSPTDQLFLLLNYRETFPLELWLAHAPSQSPQWKASGFLRLPQEDADRVARRLTKDPDQVNQTVMEFVRKRASETLRTTIYDDLLRSASAAHRERALGHMNPSGWPASAAAIEEATARELAADPIDLDRLRRVGEMLLAKRPSEKLFPVARVLLRSDDTRMIFAGLRMADSLGRQDLVADVLPHLKSMNAELRTLARKTIAAINSIAQIEDQFPRKK